MKIADIQAFHYDGLSCYEDLLISMSIYLKRDYRVAFCEAWGFEFTEDDKNILLGECFSNGQSKIVQHIKKYCGISFVNPNIARKDFEKNIKKELLQGKPVAIGLDLFWCPWSHQYQRNHDKHYLLVIGKISNGFICLETVLNSGEYILPYNYFVNGCFEIAKFKISTPSIINDYSVHLRSSVDGLSNRLNIKSMNKFIAKFENNFNFEKEFKDFENIGAEVPITHRTIFINGGRLLFTQYLKFINEFINNSDLEKIIQDIEITATKWNTVKAILFKSYYTYFDNVKQRKITNLLHDIANNEKKLVNDLCLVLDNHNTKRYFKNYNELNIGSKEYTYVELDNYYNNNGFSNSINEDSVSNFTYTGQHFIADEVSNTPIWTKKNLSFKIPKFKDESNDNISCCGQVININSLSIHKYIMILGCAEWGNSIDNMLITFLDGTTESIMFRFSNWVNGPVFNETEMWSGNGIQKTDNGAIILKKTKCKLYGIYNMINNRKRMSSIKIPYCPNIHIFAITLV